MFKKNSVKKEKKLTNEEQKILDWLVDHKQIFSREEDLYWAIEILHLEHEEKRGNKKTPPCELTIPYMEAWCDNSQLEDFFMRIMDRPVKLAKYIICLQEMGYIPKDLKPIAYHKMLSEYIPAGSRQTFWDSFTILVDDYPEKEKAKDKDFLYRKLEDMEFEYLHERPDYDDYISYLAELGRPDYYYD